MCDENQKHAFERKEEDEICSELAKNWKDRKSEPPTPPVFEVIEIRY